MTTATSLGSERALVVAPHGRDAPIAKAILAEAGVASDVCADLVSLRAELDRGAGVLLIVEEALHDQNYGEIARWLDAQPSWSDLPVIVLAQRGGGIERNPAAGRFIQALGNVSFLERPFHPTTLVSIVQTALRGRRRQYEARDRLDALRAAVIQQQTDQERLKLMVNELNHRVKNTLATVQSIVAQTLRGADVPADVRETLTSRVMALSRAHDVLTDEQWAGAELREIAFQAAVPYQAGDAEERFLLDGPAVRLPPKTAIAVALAFHELATNAAKYGALATPAGRVELTWTLRGQGERKMLRIRWEESGGPAVTPPKRTGFGTRLIERGLAADLRGRVVLSFPPDGVVCEIEAEVGDEEQIAPAEMSRSWRMTAPAASRSRDTSAAAP